jgi:hypothetical protein
MTVDWPITAGSYRSISQLSPESSDEAVETVEERPDGTVFNAMVTMEFKHKSVGVAQQEARYIRSNVLGDDGVVVLYLAPNVDGVLFT